MGQDNTINQDQGDQGRRPQQQDNSGQQQQPSQQNQQGGQSGQGQRIDTDGDGRTRDPNDTRPTDDGGRGAPVER